MAKGKYYTPEFKEQAVKMVVGLGCTYDLLHALQGQCFRLDAHPDRSRSAWLPPRTDARYYRGRIEAVPHRARRRVGLPHAHVPLRADHQCAGHAVSTGGWDASSEAPQ